VPRMAWSLGGVRLGACSGIPFPPFEDAEALRKIEGKSETRSDVLGLLSSAADMVPPEAINKYLWLRRFVQDGLTGDRNEFIRRFSGYYGLNNAGLTDEFRAAYYKFLFNHRPAEADDPYTAILRRLYKIPRRKGDRIIAASFVSKLVAMHDEAQPLYDKHVQAFFGISVPMIGSPEFRIAGFVRNLQFIRQTYEGWSKESRFKRIVARLRSNHPGLADTHANRIFDFVVWTTGARLAAEKVCG
jgi:hypothetical protein